MSFCLLVFSLFLSNASLSVSPSAPLNMSEGAALASFVLYGYVPGCNRVRYSLTGPAASLFNPPPTSFVRVMGNNETLPAVRLLSARLSDDASQLTMDFDGDVDQVLDHQGHLDF